MLKKCSKLCAGIYFFCIIAFCFSANIASAAQLEVQYPAISGQTIGADTTLPEYVLYLFKAGMFVGFFAVFLSLTIAGVIYLLSPAKPDLRASAKDRVGGAISGLLILVSTYLIITTINPQLSILRISQLPSLPPPPPVAAIPGVYFYNQAGCQAGPNDNPISNTLSRPDLGTLKNNRTNSVGIVQGVNSYITILYDRVNFWGRCQYINPNSSCTNVTPFAASASIHTYDFDPNGYGVTFYRRSYFDASGGYYFVENSQINGIYIHRLDELQFDVDGVPEEELNCISYDENGLCIDRETPTLEGENISSVEIKGNYIVLFVYFSPNDTETGIWTFCQEFPNADDINKIGPQQIKWENIRNNGGVVPNYVVIIPVQS